MGLLNRGQSWLAEKMPEAAGVPVTYTRGADSLALTAVVGRTVFRAQEEGRAAVVWGDRDYLINVADLTFGVPKVGDKITETINGEPVTFEVQLPGITPDEPAWRYSDPARLTYRLHVKRK